MFFFYLLLSFSAVGEKFYLAPPQRGFSTDEVLELTTSTRYDSESESDELAYLSIPCHFRYLMTRSPHFFCGSVGSIGSKRFLVDLDFTFLHQFTPSASVRLHGSKKQDFSTQSEAQVLELFYELSPYSSVGVSGQLDTKKSNDDAGVSYNFHSETFWARFEFNAYDYDRNKRNEQTDHFEQKPYSVGFSLLKAFKKDHLFALNLLVEPQLIWKDPQNSNYFKRDRQWLDGFYKTKIYYFALESRLVSQEMASGFQKENFVRLHGEREFGKQVKSGIRAVRRAWETGGGRLRQESFVPFVWYRPEVLNRSLSFGYDFTLYFSNGDEGLRSEGDSAFAFENRFNVAWHVLESEKGFFKLLFTFDMDQFGGEETWEGGSGQLAFTF